MSEVMSEPGVRACLVCTTPFPTDARNPGRSYCSSRCRNTAWRRRRATTAIRGAVAIRDAVDTRTRGIETRPGHGGTDGPGTVQHCPHCHRPLVLITLVTTPAAAHVTVPDPPTWAGSGTHPGVTP